MHVRSPGNGVVLNGEGVLCKIGVYKWSNLQVSACGKLLIRVTRTNFCGPKKVKTPAIAFFNATGYFIMRVDIFSPVWILIES